MRIPLIHGLVMARNEWPLLEVAVTHALVHHVDMVHVLDHASTDGTPAGLARLRREWGDRLEVVDIEGTLEEVQDQAEDSTPHAYIIRIDTVPEDREFFARWAALYGRAWPDVGFYSMHPVLRRANKIFGKVNARWLDRNALQRRIVHHYNRLLHDSDNS